LGRTSTRARPSGAIQSRPEHGRQRLQGNAVRVKAQPQIIERNPQRGDHRCVRSRARRRVRVRQLFEQLRNSPRLVDTRPASLPGHL
jgi:hypothetical protein